jgi:histidine triad (HIT) family protein
MLREILLSGQRNVRKSCAGAKGGRRSSSAAGSAGRIGSRAMPDRDPDCIFCKIIAGEIPGNIVAEDERTVAFMDISPATRGHALVVPRRHWPDLGEISEEDLAACAAAARRLATRARDALGAQGVNLMNSWGSAAWQTVFHFHVHVIPRYDGDPLQLPWRPASGDEAEIAAAAEALRGA